MDFPLPTELETHPVERHKRKVNRRKLTADKDEILSVIIVPGFLQAGLFVVDDSTQIPALTAFIKQGLSVGKKVSRVNIPMPND
jgi:hypothetical protein